MLTARCAGSLTQPSGVARTKERLEIFADGRVLVLDDYRSVAVSGSRTGGWRSTKQQKGQLKELEELAACLRDGAPWPIPLEDQLDAMRAAFAAEGQLA
jgi:hypothetical protein